MAVAGDPCHHHSDDRMAGLSSQTVYSQTGGIFMRFTAPFFLFLLLLVPLTAWMGWPAKGPAQKRESVSLTLRLVILLCLILSMAGLEIVRSGNELSVVFVMDVSDSMPQEAIDSEIAFIQNAVSAMGADDQ